MVRDGVSGIVYEDETDALEQAMRRFLAFEESERQVLCRNAETAAEAVNWRETGGKLVRHVEGESFGHAVPFQATGERRQWFMAGEPRELEGRECVCIVLHYRGLDDTRRCLSSIRAQNANIGTVLISNNENLDDIYTLRTEFPEVLSVQAAANDGFAAANNFGLWLARVAGAQFFWMVNPDVVVPDGYYNTLRSRVDQWPEHDFFGSTLVFGHRRETVAFCGGTVDIEFGKPSHMHAGARTDELPAEPFECDYLTGANIFGRVRALPHMGYLPEEYFLYFEETDWMLRYARWNGGKKAIVFPDLIAVNAKNSERDGLPSRYYVYYFCRNAHSFARRYAANGRGSELAHIGEFSDAWLKKIKKLSPGRYAEFQELFERAVNDGQKGIDGKVNGV
jgi:GT2 family glycosyltransferase